MSKKKIYTKLKNPKEGEYGFDSSGHVVVYKEGRWIDFTSLTISTSAFYDFQ